MSGPYPQHVCSCVDIPNIARNIARNRLDLLDLGSRSVDQVTLHPADSAVLSHLLVVSPESIREPSPCSSTRSCNSRGERLYDVELASARLHRAMSSWTRLTQRLSLVVIFGCFCQLIQENSRCWTVSGPSLYWLHACRGSLTADGSACWDATIEHGWLRLTPLHVIYFV
jgi:hypothetical protein